MDALSLDHLVIHVAEWDRSNAFYREVLGAEVIERGAGYAYRIGDQQLNCHGPGVDADPVARVPVAPGNSDLCFVWPGTIEEARRHLNDCGVTVEQGPVPRNGARGAGQSLYFRDPDGSLLELISYEAEEASLGADGFVVDLECESTVDVDELACDPCRVVATEDGCQACGT